MLRRPSPQAGDDISVVELVYQQDARRGIRVHHVVAAHVHVADLAGIDSRSAADRPIPVRVEFQLACRGDGIGQGCVDDELVSLKPTELVAVVLDEPEE